jgi:glycosyltransferase involved in cell wall biosynthesis
MALVSIIVPVYCNARSLPLLAEHLDALAAAHCGHEFEFVYVDDGSGDDSYDVLTLLAAKDTRIRIVKLTRNFGSNTAILAGLTYARGDCAAFIAADLQDPPGTLGDMLSCWEAGHKVVLAVRSDRLGDPWLTRFYANIFNWLFKKLVFGGFSPQGVGFFLIDRQVVDVLIRSREKNAHLIGLILWTGYRYETVEYHRVERQHGASRWSFAKKLKYFIDAFAAFSYLPLRLSSVIGLVLTAIGGLYAVVLIWLRVLGGIPVEGWTALMIVVLGASGAQLVMLGVVGEYLWRSLDASRDRPLFVVDSLFQSGRLMEPQLPASSKLVSGDGDTRTKANSGNRPS